MGKMVVALSTTVTADNVTLEKDATNVISVKDGGIDTLQLAADSVEQAKIKDGEIINADINAAAAIAASKLGSGIWTEIADVTLGAGATSIDVSSIPSGFAAIKMFITGTAGAGGAIQIQFNGDTGNNYHRELFSADGNVLAGTAGTSVSVTWADADGANEFGGFATVSNPGGGSDKVTFQTHGGSKQFFYFTTGEWDNTTEVNQITVLKAANMSAGTRLVIMGFKT